MTTPAAINPTIPVTVLIAGRPYSLRINAADEALIHRLATEINDRLKAIEASQPASDWQDRLALSLLTCAFEAHRASAQRHKPASAW